MQYYSNPVVAALTDFYFHLKFVNSMNKQMVENLEDKFFGIVTYKYYLRFDVVWGHHTALNTSYNWIY